MHLICTCNATYTVKEAVSTLYSHVYTVHAHYMYAVNTCIAQLKTYSEIQSLQDYHWRKLTIHDDSIDELEIPEGNLEDIHIYQLKTFLLRKAHFHTFVQFKSDFCRSSEFNRGYAVKTKG